MLPNRMNAPAHVFQGKMLSCAHSTNLLPHCLAMDKLRPETASLWTFSSLARPPDKPGKGRPKAVTRARREELATRVDQVMDEVRVLLVWSFCACMLMIFLPEQGG